MRIISSAIGIHPVIIRIKVRAWSSREVRRRPSLIVPSLIRIGPVLIPSLEYPFRVIESSYEFFLLLTFVLLVFLNSIDEKYEQNNTCHNRKCDCKRQSPALKGSIDSDSSL